MKKNFVIITFLTALTVVSTYLFYNYRIKSYSTAYQAGLEKSTKDIAAFTETSFKNDNITNADIKNYFEKVTKKYSQIALIYFVENNSLVMSTKKSFLLKSENDFDTFSSDLKSNSLKSGSFEEIMKSSEKYFYYLINVNNFKILVVYSFKLPFKTKLKIIFELLLLLTVFIGAATLLFVKKIKTPPADEKKDKPEKKVVENMKNFKNHTNNDTGKTALKKVKVKKVNIDTRIINTKSFESSVFDIFKKVKTNFNLSSISIYKYYNSIKSSCLLFELNNNSFSKPNKEIKSNSFKAITIELQKGSFFIKDEGRTVFIPFYSKNIFIGFLSVNSKNTISVKTAKDILKVAKPLAEKFEQFKGK